MAGLASGRPEEEWPMLVARERTEAFILALPDEVDEVRIRPVAARSDIFGVISNDIHLG